MMPGKYCFAFTPCARDANATLAPGSNVSPTIRRFSATERRSSARPSAPRCLFYDNIVKPELVLKPEGTPHAYAVLYLTDSKK